ncbi:MAG: hypothetical protein OXH04_13070 [Acidobacteria bacterium]|nr:hypothetical protein [Acidobacteriota bacterium]
MRQLPGFGEDVHAAFDHAEARVMEIRAAADRILTAPPGRDDVPWSMT